MMIESVKVLEVDAVRAFVMIADLQSFTRAAEALGSSQGAISVKLKRLEERLGKKLIITGGGLPAASTGVSGGQ
jgi:DNA-binding transcriptional LysR family regulator